MEELEMERLADHWRVATGLEEQPRIYLALLDQIHGPDIWTAVVLL